MLLLPHSELRAYRLVREVCVELPLNGEYGSQYRHYINSYYF